VVVAREGRASITNVSEPVTVAVLLTGIGDKGTVIVNVEDAVAILVRVAIDGNSVDRA
jgi:hypothetical protein